MNLRRTTIVCLVLFLIGILNGTVGAGEDSGVDVYVSKGNNQPIIDLGTVLPGGTKEFTVHLKENSSCDSIKGKVRSKLSDQGWVGGGKGQSFTVTLNAPKDKSGAHTGFIAGEFIGCGGGGKGGNGGNGESDDGDNGWNVTATVEITPVEIQVNNTKKGEDDLVQRKSKIPKNTFKTNCQIRKAVDEEGNEDMTVTLTSKNNRVGFTKNEISLPGDGEWKEFKVKGLKKSESLNDAKILAKNNSGTLVGEEDLTVFWFDKGKIDVRKGSLNYYFDQQSNVVNVRSSTRVTRFSASALLKPEGVDCSEEPVSKLRVGFVQNITANRKLIYHNPQVSWKQGAEDGTEIKNVPLKMTDSLSTSHFPDSINASDQPLYSKANSAMQPPKDCSSTEAKSFDEPVQGMPKTLTFTQKDSDGNDVADISYDWKKIVIDDKFTTYATVYHTGTEQITTVKEQKWELDVTGKAGSGITDNLSIGSASDPSTTPKTGTKIFNQFTIGDFNRTQSNNTTSFTK